MNVSQEAEDAVEHRYRHGTFGICDGAACKPIPRRTLSFNVDHLDRLIRAIATVSKRIAEVAGDGAEPINEANTKNWFVEPLLLGLGWDTHDPGAVQAEYRAHGAGQNPVDYALIVDGAPRLFVEAKAHGTSLKTPQFVNQVVAYGAVAGVQWVVITDGDEYRIYRTDTTAAAPDKLLAGFRLSDPGQQDEAVHFLTMLQRDSLALDRLTGLWVERDVDRRVRETLSELLSGVDAPFVKYLAKRLPGLRATDVAASLKRANVTIAFPKASAGQSFEQDVNRTVTTQQPSEPDAASEHVAERVSRLLAALEADGATFPARLIGSYLGRPLTTTLQRDGSFTVNGSQYRTPSGAALAAMKSVKPDSDRATVNGWKFWRYQAKTGADVRIGGLASKE